MAIYIAFKKSLRNVFISISTFEFISVYLISHKLCLGESEIYKRNRVKIKKMLFIPR